MGSIETIFLGIVQGLTEFLPVSSSGHLVIFQNYLGFREPELLLDSALHLGTLAAVCVIFRTALLEIIKDGVRGNFRSPNGRMLVAIVAGTVPTALMGLLFEDLFEELFGSLSTVGVMLLVTGGVVSISHFIPKGHGTRIRVSIPAALAIGVAQGFAIIPGISRSGTTIVCGLLCGLDRQLAARFSFLLSIPAILGALLTQIHTDVLQRVGIIPLLAGFLSSAVIGILALMLLMRMVSKGHLAYFAPYCWVLGLWVLLG